MDARFCCAGCETVAALLTEQGLTRYYELGASAGVPAALPGPTDHLWLEPIVDSVAAACATAPSAAAQLDVQGLRCSACTWLLEETFRRRPGHRRIVVDPGMGRVAFWVGPEFDLRAWVREVEAFGYVLGPPNKIPDREADMLLSRAGIAIAIAMNVMTFALAEYLGLSTGALLPWVRMLSVALAAAAVLVAAPPFLRGAFESLRRGVLSLDVPISLGIVLASAAALFGYVTTGEPRFADTLSVFVALMLVGRVLERRALSGARRQLLDVGDVPPVFVRRIEGEELRVVPAAELRAGDALLVAAGEVVPVDGVLEDEAADISLDWISGESRPESRTRGDVIGAGAFLKSLTPVRLTARTAFDASPILALLQRPAEGEGGARFWDRVARAWALIVLVAASGTQLVWGLLWGDWYGGLEATTAVLVVTCPCGIGIANPLAHELARATLRRAGLFVRTARTLDRAADVRAIVFDKTGTLTTGALRVEREVDGERPLSAEEASILLSLASSSTHPRADAVRSAFEGRARASARVRATEHIGQGMEALVDGDAYRLGSPAFALAHPTGASDVTVFAKNGAPIASFEFAEEPRADAANEIAALSGMGLEISVLSGDSEDRVRALAASLGIDGAHAFGGARPEEKAALLRARAAVPTLFIGDGLNDALAASAAFLSGTPAIDRPFLPARTDFHFTAGRRERGAGGLAPIRALLTVGHRLRQVTRRNLAFAFAYNAVVIAVAASGAMHPWLAALLMPLSSLAVIGSAALAFRAPRPSTPRAVRSAAITPEVAWKS